MSVWVVRYLTEDDFGMVYKYAAFHNEKDAEQFAYIWQSAAVKVEVK